MMRSDAEVLYQWEQELFSRHKESTAKTYRTGPRAFARWAGHDGDCDQASSRDDTDWLRECLHSQISRSDCTSQNILGALNKSDVQAFIRDLNNGDYSDPTIRSYFFGVREFAEVAADEGWVETDPLRYGGDEKTPLEKYRISQTDTNKSQWSGGRLVDNLKDPTIVALEADAINEVIEAVPDTLSPIRNEALARTLWQTGARAEEIHRLRWSDFGGLFDEDNAEDYHPEEGTVRIRTAKKRGKATHSRWCTIRQNLRTLLDIWRDEQPIVSERSDYVFSTEQSPRMTPNRINQIMRDAFDAAGFDDSYLDASGQERHKYTTHIMRASYLTHCANEVDEIQMHHLQYLAGHEDISQTMRYVKVDVEASVKASKYGPR